MMEFNEKLQELRKQKGMTQEELAGALYVSRAAISKWESGRGYPSIDSLKALAAFFEITIDELLSGEALLTAAESEIKQQKKHFLSLAVGLLDLSAVLLLFLPFFGQRANGVLQAVPLLSLTGISAWLKAVSVVVVMAIAALGVLSLALRRQYCNQISFVTNTAGVLLFIISRQPYAAVFLFALLAIKTFLLFKQR